MGKKHSGRPRRPPQPAAVAPPPEDTLPALVAAAPPVESVDARQQTGLATLDPATARAELPDDLPEAEWERIGRGFTAAASHLSWAIGRWLNFGDRRYGRTGEGLYHRAAELTSFAEQTLRVFAHVEARVRPEVRVAELSWSHHRSVAGLADPAEQRAWLDRALREGLSSRDLERVVVARLAPGAPMIEATGSPRESARVAAARRALEKLKAAERRVLAPLAASERRQLGKEGDPVARLKAAARRLHPADRLAVGRVLMEGWLCLLSPWLIERAKALDQEVGKEFGVPGGASLVPSTLPLFMWLCTRVPRAPFGWAALPALVEESKAFSFSVPWGAIFHPLPTPFDDGDAPRAELLTRALRKLGCESRERDDGVVEWCRLELEELPPDDQLPLPLARGRSHEEEDDLEEDEEDDPADDLE